MFVVKLTSNNKVNCFNMLTAQNCTGTVTTYFNFSIQSLLVPSTKRLDVLSQSSKQHGPRLQCFVRLQLLYLDWQTLFRSSLVFLWVSNQMPPHGCFSTVGHYSLTVASVRMTKSGHSSPSHSQWKIFEVASVQYVCAGHPIYVWVKVRIFPWACVFSNVKLYRILPSLLLIYNEHPDLLQGGDSGALQG